MAKIDCTNGPWTTSDGGDTRIYFNLQRGDCLAQSFTVTTASSAGHLMSVQIANPSGNWDDGFSGLTVTLHGLNGADFTSEPAPPWGDIPTGTPAVGGWFKPLGIGYLYLGTITTFPTSITLAAPDPAADCSPKLTMALGDKRLGEPGTVAVAAGPYPTSANTILGRGTVDSASIPYSDFSPALAFSDADDVDTIDLTLGSRTFSLQKDRSVPLTWRSGSTAAPGVTVSFLGQSVDVQYRPSQVSIPSGTPVSDLRIGFAGDQLARVNIALEIPNPTSTTLTEVAETMEGRTNKIRGVDIPFGDFLGAVALDDDKSVLYFGGENLPADLACADFELLADTTGGTPYTPPKLDCTLTATPARTVNNANVHSSTTLRWTAVGAETVTLHRVVADPSSGRAIITQVPITGTTGGSVNNTPNTDSRYVLNVIAPDGRTKTCDVNVTVDRGTDSGGGATPATGPGMQITVEFNYRIAYTTIKVIVDVWRADGFTVSVDIPGARDIDMSETGLDTSVFHSFDAAEPAVIYYTSFAGVVVKDVTVTQGSDTVSYGPIHIASGDDDNTWTRNESGFLGIETTSFTSPVIGAPPIAS